MFFITATAAAKLLQSCPTLCDPTDGSPPGFPIPGILQARTLEWAAMSFSNAWKWKVKVKSLSRVRSSATPWTAAFQAPPPMGFSGKSTGVGCHCLPLVFHRTSDLILTPGNYYSVLHDSFFCQDCHANKFYVTLGGWFLSLSATQCLWDSSKLLHLSVLCFFYCCTVFHGVDVLQFVYAFTP